MDTPGKAPEQGRRPYHWWKISDLRTHGFIDALNAAGDDDRLEFHPDTMLLHIRSDGPSTQDHDPGGYNFSHTCPPDCR